MAPFYLKVLHGNVVGERYASRRLQVQAEMAAVAGEVTFDVALELWPRGWREGLMASWWAAVWRWSAAVEQVAGLLIPSRSTYEGQGHCIALARIATPSARHLLMRYLDTYLPRHDLYYDQRWAMAALTSVCRQGGTGVPDRYLAAWDQWQAATSAGSCDQRWMFLIESSRSPTRCTGRRWHAANEASLVSPGSPVSAPPKFRPALARLIASARSQD